MSEQIMDKRPLYSLTVAQFVSFIFFVLALFPVFTDFNGGHGIGFYNGSLGKLTVYEIIFVLAGLNGVRVFLSSLEVEVNPAFYGLVKDDFKFQKLDWWTRASWLILVLLIPIDLMECSGNGIEILMILLFLSLTIWNFQVLHRLHTKINTLQNEKFEWKIIVKLIWWGTKYDDADVIAIGKVHIDFINDEKEKLTTINDETERKTKENEINKRFEIKKLLEFRKFVRIWAYEEAIFLVLSILYFIFAFCFSETHQVAFNQFLGAFTLISCLIFFFELIQIDIGSYGIRIAICSLIAFPIWLIFYNHLAIIKYLWAYLIS